MNNNLKNNLNPVWFITGFVDAEGCFRVSIIKNKNYESSLKNRTALPLKVRLYFQIGLHRKDEDILELIRSSLGVGKIYRKSLGVGKFILSFALLCFTLLYFDWYFLLDFFSFDPFLSLLLAPVKIYSTLDKDKIIKDNKEKSGIYLWTNLINNKTYIGSSGEIFQ